MGPDWIRGYGWIRGRSCAWNLYTALCLLLGEKNVERENKNKQDEQKYGKDTARIEK